MAKAKKATAAAPANVEEPESPALSINIEEGSGKVIIQDKQGAIISEGSVSTEPKVGGDQAFRVSFSLERKVNLGNYESAGFFVSLSAPTSLADLDGDFEEVRAWVEMKAGEVVDSIKTNSEG